MDTLMKANVFFFVTTIAVVIFLVLGIVISAYIIRILRNIQRTSEKLEKSIGNIGEQAEALSDKIAESFLFNLLFGKKAKKRTMKE